MPDKLPYGKIELKRDHVIIVGLIAVVASAIAYPYFSGSLEKKGIVDPDSLSGKTFEGAALTATSQSLNCNPDSLLKKGTIKEGRVEIYCAEAGKVSQSNALEIQTALKDTFPFQNFKVQVGPNKRSVEIIITDPKPTSQIQEKS